MRDDVRTCLEQIRKLADLVLDYASRIEYLVEFTTAVSNKSRVSLLADKEQPI